MNAETHGRTNNHQFSSGRARLGFVMCNVPEQLPGVVKLLAESHGLKREERALLTLDLARNQP